MSPWHYDALMDSTDPIPKKLDPIGMSPYSLPARLPLISFLQITNSRPSRRANPEGHFY